MTNIINAEDFSIDSDISKWDLLEKVKRLAEKYQLNVTLSAYFKETPSYESNQDDEESDNEDEAFYQIETEVESRCRLNITKTTASSDSEEIPHPNWSAFEKEFNDKFCAIFEKIDGLSEVNFQSNQMNSSEQQTETNVSQIHANSNKPCYMFSTTNWTRIWFTKNPNICITPEKKQDIIEFLEKYPDFRITLIYDDQLLNAQGQIHLQSTMIELYLRFGDRIHYTNIRGPFFEQALQSDTEKLLFERAKEELNHLDNGGNVAAASDMIRVMGPSYRAGIYTDFDVMFEEQVYAYFSAHSPVVFSIKFSNERFHYCNDIIAIHPDPSLHQDGSLQAIQKTILQKYTNIDNEKNCLNMARSFFKETTRPEIFYSKFQLLFDKFDKSLPPLFRLRKVLESACLTSMNIDFRKACKKVLMLSVIEVTGPGCLPENMVHSSNLGGKITLNEIVKGQGSGVANEGSWVPKNKDIYAQTIRPTAVNSISSEDRIIKNQQNIRLNIQEFKEKLKINSNQEKMQHDDTQKKST